MLNRDLVLEAFQKAIGELDLPENQKAASVTRIADCAHRIYCQQLAVGQKHPSLWTFRSYVLGRRFNKEVAELLSSMRVQKTPRLDQGLVLQAFRSALEIGIVKHGEKLRPRTVAVLAHQCYCLGISAEHKRPSLVSFTQKVTGRTRDPEVIAFLRSAGIQNERHVLLNRERLKEAFVECIQRMESRILRGIAKPLHVADNAYRIYTDRLDDSELKPSRQTFRRIIYGKDADPEIASLLQAHFPNRR